jgi:competence protein ComEC
MFTLVILGQAWERQSSLFNTLSAAACLLLLYNPYLLCDVGFQLSFLAVVSIVYLQPRIVRWLDVRNAVLDCQRSWHGPAQQRLWRASAWLADAAWQLSALSIAAQIATFPLGLYYFHQFPFNFLLSNLIAVPISSVAVYVGVVLLLVKGVVALPALWLPALDWLPRAVGGVFQGLIWLFNEYIFLVGRLLPGAVVGGVHLNQTQTLLIFLLIVAVCAFFATRRLAWVGGMLALLGLYAGSRVAEAADVAPVREFVVYSIPRRSVVGFWQGAAPEFVTADSLPLSETERTYRLKPSLILRRVRQPRYCVGWRGAAVPTRLVGAASPADSAGRYPPVPVVLASWRGLRVAFVSGRLRRLPAGVAPLVPADVVVLRRNARVYPDGLAAHFGSRARVVFDSSCKRWYIARQDTTLRAAGFRTWDVNAQGAFIYPLIVRR